MDKDIFKIKKRLEDLYRQSYAHDSFVFTRFLSPSDAALVYDVADDGAVKMWGGAEGCERVMVRFGDEAKLGYGVDFPISVLKVRPVNPKYCEGLTHRDYLGAFMSLGLERDTIGDIIVKEKNGYAFVCDSIAGHICEELNSIRNTSVLCVKCYEVSAGEAVPKPEFEACTLIVPSPRIDAMISKLYNLSRSKARNLFTSGMVLLNGRSCGNESLTPKEKDVFAVRGYGKFLFDGVGEKTKKGNVIVRVRRYA